VKPWMCSRLALALPAAVAFVLILPAAAGASEINPPGGKLIWDGDANDNLGSKFDPPTTGYSNPGLDLKLSIPYKDPFPKGSTHKYWFPPDSPWAYDEEEGLFYHKKGGWLWGGATLPPGVKERPPTPPEPEPEPPTITFEEDTGGSPDIESVIPELAGADPQSSEPEDTVWDPSLPGLSPLPPVPQEDYDNAKDIRTQTLLEILDAQIFDANKALDAYSDATHKLEEAEKANAAAGGWDPDLEDAAINAKHAKDMAQSDYNEALNAVQKTQEKYEESQPLIITIPPKF